MSVNVVRQRLCRIVIARELERRESLRRPGGLGVSNIASANFMETNHWVKDTPRVRGFDGKRLKIEGKGIFLMKVQETDSNGNRNPGHVQVLAEPYDLESAMGFAPL